MPHVANATTDRFPALPDLEPGVQLLEIDDGHGIAPLQSLVLDHVLAHDGPALWVDAGRHAVTSSLRELAPSDRVLERLRIARGFTPYQHTALLRGLRTHAARAAASLVVVSAVDAQYRSDDVRGETGQDMLLAALADVARVAREHDLPVLLTRQTADEFSEPVATFADRTIEYHSTAFGPRFVGEDVDTRVYHLKGGVVQTTFAFWQEVLAERAARHEASATEVSAVGAH